MKRSKFTEAQIAFILRQAEEGTAVAEVCRKAGISDATFYSWKKRYGGLTDRRLRTVPVNFLSDLDVTGGNSGSPVLDARGELVGLLFDMNWEAVVSNWVFDADMTRTISVDQRYMRWIMQEIYPAPQLLQEMGVAPRR